MLRAAAELLAEKTFSELTILEITQEAGASISSFYARFGDKKGLLQEMHRRYGESSVRDTREGGIAFVPGRLTLSRLAAIFVMTQLQLYRQNRGLIRAVLMESFTDDGIASRAREFYRENARFLARCVDPNGASPPHLVDDIEAGMLAVKAMLDQEFNLTRAPGPGFDMPVALVKEKAQRLQRIFLACFDPGNLGQPRAIERETASPVSRERG